MTRNMVKVFTHGRMEDIIKEDSSTVNNMVRVYTNKSMALKHMEFGKKERRVFFVRTALNGLSSKITYESYRIRKNETYNID